MALTTEQKREAQRIAEQISVGVATDAFEAYAEDPRWIPYEIERLATDLSEFARHSVRIHGPDYLPTLWISNLAMYLSIWNRYRYDLREHAREIEEMYELSSRPVYHRRDEDPLSRENLRKRLGRGRRRMR